MSAPRRVLPGDRLVGRAVRVEHDLWTDAQVAAERNGETVSDVIRRALAAYVRRSSRQRGVTPRSLGETMRKAVES